MYDIIYGVVEQRDQPRDADDGQRLRCKDTEHHRRKGGREERFVDTIELSSSPVHIQRVGYGREYARERVLALESGRELDKPTSRNTCE